MIFDDLIGKPMSELELFDLVCRDVQKNYSKFQETWLFLKLKKSDRGSEIEWAKAFPSAKEARKFYYDSKTWRACIMVRFEEGCYQPIMFGHTYCSGYVDVWADRIEAEDFREADPNLESRKLVDLGKLFGGFDQIQATLIKKRKIAV
jgi:hypothetical protein